MNTDTFSGFHPAVNLLYFLLVLVFGMFLMHPVCLAISLAGAIGYSCYLKGARALRFQVRLILPLMLLTAVLNPLFNHEGATILTYLHSGNPLTLESICYGVAAAAMLATVVTWFSCCNVVMTSDKFVYLFGRVIPALSLLLSMTLRFVPRFHTQIKAVAQAQRCVGRDVSTGNLFTRIRNGITIFSIVLTWALENAIHTADSMRSRGYSLPGRTAFSIYRFERRDLAALVLLLALAVFLLIANAQDAAAWQYFPRVGGTVTGLYALSSFAAYFLLCMTPLLIDWSEDLKWKFLASKI